MVVAEAGHVASAAAWGAFYTAQDAFVRTQRRKERAARRYAAVCAAWAVAVEAVHNARQLLPDGGERVDVD